MSRREPVLLKAPMRVLAPTSWCEVGAEYADRLADIGVTVITDTPWALHKENQFTENRSAP
jgi:hypothetical protein